MIVVLVSLVLGAICFISIGRLLAHQAARARARYASVSCFAIGLSCMIIPFFDADLFVLMLFGCPLALFGIISIIRVQLTP